MCKFNSQSGVGGEYTNISVWIISQISCKIPAYELLAKDTILCFPSMYDNRLQPYKSSPELSNISHKLHQLMLSNHGDLVTAGAHLIRPMKYDLMLFLNHILTK